MRRHTWKAAWITVVVMALAMAGMLATTGTAAATTADAAALRACPAIYPTPSYCRPHLPQQYRTAGLRHTGWTYLNLNYCAPGYACAAIYRMSMPAWSWTNGAWKQTSLKGGWVYVYPYTGEWRWAWTQSSGWVAVNSGRFELR